jgi:YihY family inner membrane protein
MASIASFFSFFKQVLISFRANQGIVLAGAIAYYTLLSIIPMFTLLIIALSHLIDEQQLLFIVESNLAPIFGENAEAITLQMEIFLENRKTVSWVVLLVLLFFSSFAFSVLESSMATIFFHRVKIHRRHFLVSAIIPYCYIFLVGIGILLITIISSALGLLKGEVVTIFIWQLEIDHMTGKLLYGLGILGLTFLLASFYMVMPVGRISFRHAIVGSFCVAVAWEVTRHIMVWYFSTLSMVSVIYGSLTTAIVALLFLEVGAIILLFGAQIIAEYERLERQDSPQSVSNDSDFIN